MKGKRVRDESEGETKEEKYKAEKVKGKGWKKKGRKVTREERYPRRRRGGGIQVEEGEED